MYDRFGEFNSAEEINETAVNLRREGDIESIKVLAKENGIDEEIVEYFVEGTMLYICDKSSAAIGKLEIEAESMKCTEILDDWVTYLKMQADENEALAVAIRKKGKTLAGAIAALLKWSFNNRTKLPEEISKAAGITARCELGMPGQARAKKIMTDYYLGK